MGVFTPKRAVLFVVAVLLGVTASAGNPSPRTQARMAWDPVNTVGVLFGGVGNLDGATQLQHDSAETWLWNGSRWLQRFPTTIPPGRGVHSMVYDTTRNRIVMFGGRKSAPEVGVDPTFLNDTWVYSNGDWTSVDSSLRPPVRQYAAMAYDRVRDRVVLYGGNKLNIDGTTFDPYDDTWEFDGQQWTQVSSDGPDVAKPELGYDATRNQVIMIGLNATATARVMYRLENGAWVSITPATFPTCVNDGHLIYREHRGRLAFIGGACATGTPAAEEIFEWDGTNWTKLTLNSWARQSAQAVAYDPLRREIVTFGGTNIFGGAFGSQTFVMRNETFRTTFFDLSPSPRSFAGFQTDPTSNTIWMFGGLEETSTFYQADLWGYRNGQWFEALSGPTTCESNLSAWDSDRNRLVISCAAADIFEWDGTAWKTVTIDDDDDAPDPRSFAAMVYDPTLKRTVLFGGYFNNNFRNDTWTWNGTAWAEVKMDNDERPPHRSQMAMWYDPLLKKVVLYGGIGRGGLNERVTRYSDMWAFNGTGWTKLNVTETPGVRFGPQVAANPVTGKVLLFGGLRAVPREDDPEGEKLRQFFANDTWEWDGGASKWTLIPGNPLTPEPEVRENGSMAWDPVASQLVLFAGYAEGFYRSDVWVWTGTDWVPRLDHASRRRAAH